MLFSSALNLRFVLFMSADESSSLADELESSSQKDAVSSSQMESDSSTQKGTSSIWVINCWSSSWRDQLLLGSKVIVVGGSERVYPLFKVLVHLGKRNADVVSDVVCFGVTWKKILCVIVNLYFVGSIHAVVEYKSNRL